MAINARGSMVFDLKTLQEQKKKAGDGPVVTYSHSEKGMECATAENPILVLKDEEGKLRHHVDGQFMNPSRRTGFEYKLDGTPAFADILLLDKRCLAEEHFLGPGASAFFRRTDSGGICSLQDPGGEFFRKGTVQYGQLSAAGDRKTSGESSGGGVRS